MAEGFLSKFVNMLELMASSLHRQSTLYVFQGSTIHNDSIRSYVIITAKNNKKHNLTVRKKFHAYT